VKGGKLDPVRPIPSPPRAKRSDGRKSEPLSQGYTLQADVSLRPFNTFGVEARAAYLLTVHESRALPAALADSRIGAMPVMCIGEGSNLLLVGDHPGVALRQTADSVTVLEDDGEALRIRADAGCVWDALVDWTLARGCAGLENLALIPGLVGAAPIQNIGAYGTEIDEFITGVAAWDRSSAAPVRLTRDECGFTYRDSRFKREVDRWIVTGLELTLPRQREPRLDYPGVREELGPCDGPPAPAAIAAAVRRIRRRRLPDPAVIGNAGSFFKNPIVGAEHARRLLAENPGLPSYPVAGSDRRKLPAAWLIEACGWRGYREGDAGVSSRHALVLVNHGRASGAQILALAERIVISVEQRFGVALVPEPRIVGAR
jgi:UDP-N-acetylmuramate dehydrogenase